jgi:hypothetical protein
MSTEDRIRDVCNFYHYNTGEENESITLTSGCTAEPLLPVKPAELHKCRCKTFDLVNFGCKCGGV